MYTQTYEPQFIHRVSISKSGGGERPLAIPHSGLVVVQTVGKLIIEPILYLASFIKEMRRSFFKPFDEAGEPFQRAERRWKELRKVRFSDKCRLRPLIG
jgi:hypothetical protein